MGAQTANRYAHPLPWSLQQSQPAAPDGSITTTFGGHQYNVRRINHTLYRYSYDIHENHIHSTHGALVDSGANGGMAGPDTRVLSIVPNAHVDITGISGSPIEQLPLVQCAALVNTLDEGQVILIMSQYAHSPKGKTIHSKCQLESFGCSVHDSALRAGGKQCIYTPEGYVIPLHVRHGLFYMDMQPPTDDDLHNHPHVFLTPDSPWNPDNVDEEFHHDALSDTALTEDAFLQSLRNARDHRVDAYGGIHLHFFDALQDESATSDDLFFDAYESTDSYTVPCLDRCLDALAIFGIHMKRRLPDLDALKPNFGWVSKEHIKDTLDKTTQHYQAEKQVPMRKHFKSRFPGANVPHLPEWYSFDTMFYDVPALDDGIPGHGGCTMIQMFGGLDSELLHGVPMQNESEVPDSILDFIRHYGAMEGIMSDNAKSETSFAIRDILCLYTIKDHQSEPYYQHQNPIERRIQDVKCMVKSIMEPLRHLALVYSLCHWPP